MDLYGFPLLGLLLEYSPLLPNSVHYFECLLTHQPVPYSHYPA